MEGTISALLSKLKMASEASSSCKGKDDNDLKEQKSYVEFIYFVL